MDVCCTIDVRTKDWPATYRTPACTKYSTLLYMRAAQDTKRLNPDPYQTKSRPISYLPLPFRETLCLYIEDQATRPEVDEKRKLHAEREKKISTQTAHPAQTERQSRRRLHPAKTSRASLVWRKQPRSTPSSRAGGREEKSIWCAP
jgi:hypothetical protein